MEEEEEEKTRRVRSPKDSLVKVFPEVLSHKAKCTEEGPAKGVKVCVAIIGALAEALEADVVVGARSGPA